MDRKKLRKSQMIKAFDKSVLKMEMIIEEHDKQEELMKAKAKKVEDKKKLEKKEVKPEVDKKEEVTAADTMNKNRTLVDGIIKGRDLNKLEPSELDNIMDKLESLKGNKYAQIALDRVYAVYLTKTTGGGDVKEGEDKSGAKGDPRLQELVQKYKDISTKISNGEKETSKIKKVGMKKKHIHNLKVLKQIQEKVKNQINKIDPKWNGE